MSAEPLSTLVFLHTPLSCRTSPPQGGRLAISAFANRLCRCSLSTLLSAETTAILAPRNHSCEEPAMETRTSRR
ncbi:hypothetical protein FJ423_27560 [Mesorhizobium sp. B2-8-9]|nr:hypothetical protein FJ423_27560 [Mesorhizobium sp. B2-8-9]